MLSDEEPRDEGAARAQARAQAELQWFLQLLSRRAPRVWGTIALLALNVAVYALMVLSGVPAFSPPPTDMLAWGAVRGPEVLAGEWWRMFTCMFLHFGLVHIGFNMWVLRTIGPFVERLYGHLGFVTVYLVSGLVASATGLATSPYATSAGASGAIFGVVGGLMAALFVRPPEMPAAFAAALRGSLLKFIGLNVVLGLAVPQIGLSAHLGGLVGGFLCGLALGPRQLLRERSLSARLPRAAAAVVGGLALTALGPPLAALRFDASERALMELATTEPGVIEAYNEAVRRQRAGELEPEAFAALLEDEVLPPWRAMVARVEALEQREGASPRIEALLRYARERERGWELRARGLRSGDVGLLEEAQRAHDAADAAADEVE